MEENKESKVEKTEETQNKYKNVNTGLVSLELVARMNKVDIDMKAIVREFGIDTADISAEELIRVAKSSGFKIKKKNFKLKYCFLSGAHQWRVGVIPRRALMLGMSR